MSIPNNSYFQSLKNSLLSNAHAVAEIVTPVLQVSKFAETGVLTPQEFVLAGDMLVAKCPSWSWMGGDADKVRSHLPPNKQFLITRGVPCRQRANAVVGSLAHLADEEQEDGWLKTGWEDKSRNEEEEEYTSLEMATTTPTKTTKEAAEEEDYVDLVGYEESNLEVQDASTFNHLVLKTRTYDLSIMYDKYYQSPRMFLVGYDESGQQLAPTRIFEDVSHDYANKTATIESHPHLGRIRQCVSIHPCKHAQIMKKLMDRMMQQNGKARVDQALFVFLKFMQGLLPTIDYDFTMEVKFQPT